MLSTTPRKKPLKTLGEKEKMLVTSIFSFSHNVIYPFYPFGVLSAIFFKFEIVVCKLFQLDNFSFWKGIKNRSSLVRCPVRPVFSQRINDRYCDRIHSSRTAVHCFDDGYVGKQPVVWK